MRVDEKRRFWTATDDAVIHDQYAQRSVREVAAMLGRSKDSVKHRARKLGVAEEGSAAWSDDETAYLRDNYATKTVPEISATLGRSLTACYVRANVLGLKGFHHAGRHSLTPGFFRVIDTPLKAYLLGLLTADGSVSRKGQVQLALAEKDQDLVAYARDIIAPDARIKHYQVRGYPNAVFKVQNADLAADLALHGVVPNKTPITYWPETIPREHAGSYLCGVSDGDGSLERRWIYHWTLTSGTKRFLEQVRGRIFEYTGIQAGTHVYPDKRKGKTSTWRIAVTGMPVRTLDAWMHRDVPGLARKRLPPSSQTELDIAG